MEVESIKNEIKINLELNHPNIAKLEEIQETQCTLYLIFEFVDGNPIAEEKLKSKKKNSEIQLTIYKILKVLEYLESLSIVHRDLKPSNILITKEGDIKVIDFGLSSTDPKEVFFFCGTPEFIAPELFGKPQKTQFNSKIDIFSLGVIFYIFQFGRYPLEFNKNEKNNFRLQSYSEQIMEEGDFLAYDLLEKMLNVNQKVRYGVKECLKHAYFNNVKRAEKKKEVSISSHLVVYHTSKTL